MNIELSLFGVGGEHDKTGCRHFLKICSWIFAHWLVSGQFYCHRIRNNNIGCYTVPDMENSMNYELWIFVGLIMLALFIFAVHLANKQDKESRR